MTVHELLNGVIYAGVLAGALTGIGTFLHFAAVRPMRSFLRKEIVGSLVEIREAVEHNTQVADDLKVKVDRLAIELDKHIVTGHTP